MMKFIAIALLITGNTLAAKAFASIVLSCIGTYSNIESKESELPTEGNIQMEGDSILINGIPYFFSDEHYKVVRSNNFTIFFNHSKDASYQGSINRFSGKTRLIHLDPKNNRWRSSLDGKCLPSQRIF